MGTLCVLPETPPGEITMALRCCPGLGLFEPFEGNKGVWIQTFDSAGKPSDRSFPLDRSDALKRLPLQAVALCCAGVNFRSRSPARTN
jgi:hypothetical protein